MNWAHFCFGPIPDGKIYDINTVDVCHEPTCFLHLHARAKADMIELAAIPARYGGGNCSWPHLRLASQPAYSPNVVGGTR